MQREEWIRAHAYPLERHAITSLAFFVERIRHNASSITKTLRGSVPEFSSFLLIGAPEGIRGLLIPSPLTTAERRDEVLYRIIPDAARIYNATALAYCAITYANKNRQGSEAARSRTTTMREQIERGNFTDSKAIIAITDGTTLQTYVMPLDGDPVLDEIEIGGAYVEALKDAFAPRG